MPNTDPTSPPAARILVVEDMPDTRESLQELLQIALGLEVDTAGDGSRALEMMAAKKYDLVLTDLRMPCAGGLHLLRELRDRGSVVPVIVTTGHGTVREAVEAMKLGAQDFLTKPIDPQRLLAIVESTLREQAARRKRVAGEA